MPVIACPHCGRSLKVREELAGRRMRCPKCQQTILSLAAPPEVTEHKTLPPAPDPAPVASKNSPEARTIAGSSPGPLDEETLGGLPEPSNDLTAFLAPAQEPDELGRLGPYRVLRVLGAGGMGVVFRAEDPRLQRPVALKAMLPKLAVTESAKQRFLREARAAAAIKHDHIVTVYQVDEDRGIPFLAMEFLEGEPLDQRLKRENKLSVPEVLRIGRELAEGLEAAHGRGLMHRDIKPANVWLEGKKARTKILDFGLARENTSEAQLTQVGTILGTPSYMAPEQAQGLPLDHRCDLFSLGCVLYQASTGVLPFRGKDTIHTLIAVNSHNPPAPRELNPALPEPLSALVMRLLAKAPANRPASAGEVAQELAAMAEGNTTVRLPPPPRKVLRKGTPSPTPPPQPAPAGRSWLPLVVTLVILLLGLGAAAFWLVPGLFQNQAEQGTLVVEVPEGEADPGRLTIKQGDRQVKQLDLKAGKQVHLDPGTYRLELLGGRDGLKLDATEVALKGGDQRTVKLAFEKPGAGQAGDPRPLFNGQDLTGWEGLPEHWTWKDGVLTGSAPQGLKTSTFLCSKKTYGDFELEFEVRLKGDKPNSGLQIRSELFDRKLFVVRGPQCDMGEGFWGCLYGEGSGGMMKAADQDAVAKLLRTGDYNTFFVRCVGSQVVIRLNGQTTVDGQFPTMPREGILAWQLHAGGPIEVNFRKIKFKELSTKVEPPVGPKESRPLFNGKDLTGWETVGKVKWDWVGEVLKLGSDGPAWIATTRDYVDFEIEMEYRLPPKGNSGIFIRAWKGGDITGHDFLEVQLLDDAGHPTFKPDTRNGAIFKIAAPMPRPQAPAEKWNRVRVRAEGSRIQVVINGVTVQETTVERNEKKGRIGLQIHKTGVEFKKVKVREL